MSENKSKGQNSRANNDEDFGLPEVTVTPLKSAVANTAAAPGPVLTGKEKTDSGKPKGSEKEKKERRSNGALWLILLLILLIGFGAYYWSDFDYFIPDSEKDEAPTAQSEEPVEVTPEPAPIPEPIVEVPVVEAATPVLTEVAGRADSPRYFLVVGSFIDDDLARDYSERLNKAGLETFLVHPYGSIHFYRLAVGQYENLDTALEAMDASQKEYEENLWVLKY